MKMPFIIVADIVVTTRFISHLELKLFITDGRYSVDVKENIKNNSEIIISNDLTKEARKLLKKVK